jgi:hypothetical protein
MGCCNLLMSAVVRRFMQQSQGAKTLILSDFEQIEVLLCFALMTRARARHINFLRLNTVTSAASSSNHSPPLRLAANRPCQYASIPAGSSVLIL